MNKSNVFKATDTFIFKKRRLSEIEDEKDKIKSQNNTELSSRSMLKQTESKTCKENVNYKGDLTFCNDKKKKDPAAPKKPRTAYLFFSDETCPKFCKENPNLKVEEVFNIISKEWTKLKDKDKVKYQKLSEQAKKKFQLQLKEYEEKGYYTRDDGTKSSCPSKEEGEVKENQQKEKPQNKMSSEFIKNNCQLKTGNLVCQNTMCEFPVKYVCFGCDEEICVLCKASHHMDCEVSPLMSKEEFEILQGYCNGLVENYEKLVEFKGTKYEDMKKVEMACNYIDRTVLAADSCKTEIDYTWKCFTIERIIYDIKNIQLSVDSMKLLMEISMRKNIFSTSTINKDGNKSSEVKEQDENSDYDIKNKEENLQNIKNSKNTEQEFDGEKEVSSSSDDSSSEYSSIKSKSKPSARNSNEERVFKEGPFVKRSFSGSLDPDFLSKAAKESSKKQNIPKTAPQPSNLNPHNPDSQAHPFTNRKKPDNIFPTNPFSFSSSPSSSPHSKPNPFKKSAKTEPSCIKPNPFSNPVKSTNNPYSNVSVVSCSIPFAKIHDKCVESLNVNDNKKVAASDNPPKSTNPFARRGKVDINRKNPFAPK